jgi:eukaryotic-like serine/threonine-protein kinase
LDEQMIIKVKDKKMTKQPLSLTILLLGCIIISGCGSFAGPTPTIAAAATAAPAAVPTETPTAQPTAIPTATSIPTDAPTPAPGAVQVSAKDGMEMVYVPAGDFSMGSLAGTSDEQPVHTVTLAAYWIDKTEITNVMYSQCVQAGDCQKPQNQSNTHFSYFLNPEFANYPVVNLKWSSAQKYCAWAGRRLPTEAEWEKAARGTDGRTYPWGNGDPNATLLNFNTPAGDAVRVGSYPHGASPYGALDMAGNLREWVADWYDPGYYAVSPQSNPTGLAEGQYKVVRGGSWHSDLYSVRSSDRAYQAPDTRDKTIGFRCVVTGP